MCKGHIPDFAIDGKLLEVARRSAFLPNGRALPVPSYLERDV